MRPEFYRLYLETRSENGILIKLLLCYSDRCNIDLNAKSDRGWTGFMEACRNGYKDVVKILLDHLGSQPIDYTAKNNYGQTANALASKYGHTNVVKLLRKYSKNKDC